MMWSGPFELFPRELGFPQRSCIVYNLEEFLQKINLHNHKTDTYSSLYSFDRFQTNGKPDYNSAKITHIYFDLDNADCLKSCRTLHKYLQAESLRHCIYFSGGGFHIHVSAEYPNFLMNKKAAIFNAVVEIADKVGLKVGINGNSDIDAHTVGDIARIVRVPNTYNLKRKRFCIPISTKDLEKSIEEIHQMAQKQIERCYIYGSKSLDLNPYDREPKEEYRIPALETSDESLGIENINIDRFLPCVKNLLTAKNIKHRQRYIIITYCKEIGLPLRDTILLLKKYLEPSIWNHCIHEERQPIFIYRRADLVFPNCEKIKGEGLCVEGNLCRR
jgi:hypothetical protein